MTIKERMLYYADEHRISRKDLVVATGISTELFTPNNITRDFNASRVVRFAESYPGCSLDWLLLGKGKMDKSSYQFDRDDKDIIIQSLQEQIEALKQSNADLRELCEVYKKRSHEK